MNICLLCQTLLRLLWARNSCNESYRHLTQQLLPQLEYLLLHTSKRFRIVKLNAVMTWYLSSDNCSWLQPTIQITIEVLHLVFSAFGFVHKLATFEKAAGFQALVQYGDSETADQVRQALDGRHIPRHVLNDHPNPPMLKLSFSQHTDLNVKFQSHRSR